jgi:hypothetical protein
MWLAKSIAADFISAAAQQIYSTLCERGAAETIEEPREGD